MGAVNLVADHAELEQVALEVAARDQRQVARPPSGC